MIEIGSLRSWINEDCALQRLLLKAFTDKGAETIKNWLARVQENALCAISRYMHRTGSAQFRRIDFQHRQEPVECSWLEGAERKSRVKIALNAKVQKRCGFLYKSTHIARQQLAIGFLLNRCSQAWQFTHYRTAITEQCTLTLLDRFHL